MMIYIEVNVSRTATVAELKEAVKDVFRQLTNETESYISWYVRVRQSCLMNDTSTSIYGFIFITYVTLCIINFTTINI